MITKAKTECKKKKNLFLFVVMVTIDIHRIRYSNSFKRHKDAMHIHYMDQRFMDTSPPHTYLPHTAVGSTLVYKSLYSFPLIGTKRPKMDPKL